MLSSLYSPDPVHTGSGFFYVRSRQIHRVTAFDREVAQSSWYVSLKVEDSTVADLGRRESLGRRSASRLASLVGCMAGVSVGVEGDVSARGERLPRGVLGWLPRRGVRSRIG